MPAITESTFWNQHWSSVKFEAAVKSHPVRKWIEENIPDTHGGSCFEVGCYPGKFLAVLGEKGYELNGIDNHSGTNPKVSDWLSDERFNVGRIEQNDFEVFQTNKLYDLVCSFGYIEHFTDWQAVIKQHVALTKNGGIVAIETPNFNSPLYKNIYKILEPAMLQNHVLSAMDLKGIENTLINAGCEILNTGYIGEFYFKFATRQDALSRVIATSLNALRPLINLFSRRLSARYLGVVAKRVSD